MPSLKNRDNTSIKKGYYIREAGYRLSHIHKRRGSWYAQFTDGGLVDLTQVIFKNYHKCKDQKKAAEDFEEEATARRNNLERVLKKSNGNH